MKSYIKKPIKLINVEEVTSTLLLSRSIFEGYENRFLDEQLLIIDEFFMLLKGKLTKNSNIVHRYNLMSYRGLGKSSILTIPALITAMLMFEFFSFCVIVKINSATAKNFFRVTLKSFLALRKNGSACKRKVSYY